MCESSHPWAASDAAFAPTMSEAASDTERPHASGAPGLRCTQHVTVSVQVACA